MYFEGEDRIYIAGQAWLLGQVRPGVEVSTSAWAADHIIQNEANAYILGKFVEAERANNNKQYFRMGDLLMAQPTISYAPLNLNHESSPVGAFVATAMQYPSEAEGNAYIEALSCMWKHYYPEVYETIARHFAEASLFYSMEAVPRTLSTIGGSDDAAEYAYEGRQSKNYPDEINERSCEAIVLNNPHFVGGALILPPATPGWSRAEINQISKFLEQQWETAESIYSGIQQQAPHLDPNTWETLMNEFILYTLEDAEREGLTAEWMKKRKKNAPK